MNRKQKMIYRMWKNYIHNCNIQGDKPLYNYKIFRNVYQMESFEEILNTKKWYKDKRI